MIIALILAPRTWYHVKYGRTTHKSKLEAELDQTYPIVSINEMTAIVIEVQKLAVFVITSL